MIASRIRRGGAAALAATAAVLLLTGCELLAPSSYEVDEWIDTATYVSGSATLTITGDPHGPRELPLGVGGLEDSLGASAVFQDDEGWAVSIVASEEGDDPFMGFTELEVHRAVLGHWVANDGQADCDIKIEQANLSGVEGTASCTGLRWTDAVGDLVMVGSGPRFIEGEPPFDATVTFAARSAPSTVSRTARPTDPPPPLVDLDTAAESARALPTVEEVHVSRDWLDGDSLEVVLEQPATDTAAREVWCDVLLPVNIGPEIAYVGDAEAYWDPPRDCADPEDVPAAYRLVLTNGFQTFDPELEDDDTDGAAE